MGEGCKFVMVDVGGDKGGKEGVVRSTWDSVIEVGRSSSRPSCKEADSMIDVGKGGTGGTCSSMSSLSPLMETGEVSPEEVKVFQGSTGSRAPTLPLRTFKQKVVNQFSF